MSDETKRCPFCDELIRVHAIKCRFCASMLAAAPPGTPPPMGTSPSIVQPVWSQVGTYIPDGTEIREYRFLRLLGEGGMGEVYLAEHTYTAQKVAIKAVSPMLMRDQSIRRRFLEEGRLMASLDHNNIVRLHNFFEEASRFFLIMEYVEGQSLDHLAKDVPMEPAFAVSLVGAVLDALEYAHTRPAPVIHRDIKPGNLLINGDGQVKITDFGIAKAVGREKLTRTGGVVGTYEYMSPEQIRGEECGPATDLYSVGIMLFQLLAGRVPFPQTSPSGIDAMQGHLHLPPPPLAELCPGISAPLQVAVDRSLAKSVTDRWTSAAAMRAGLVTSEPVEEKAPDPPPPRPPTPPPLRVTGSPPQEVLAHGPSNAPMDNQKGLLGRLAEIRPDLDMVRVTPGAFDMGSPPSEEGRAQDEGLRRVEIRHPFLVGAAPVSVSQWCAVFGADSCRTVGADPDSPMVNVSWYDAVEFCNRLSDLIGLPPTYEVAQTLTGRRRVREDDCGGFRLPTEQEWEYACRAGSRAARHGPLDEIAWYGGAWFGTAQPVRRKAPNAWGLFDMLGNVWEWCSDYAFSEDELKPDWRRGGAHRVVRGGSWQSAENLVRAAVHQHEPPDTEKPTLGFRIACSVTVFGPALG